MLSRVIGEDIELLTHLSSEAMTINADPGQIEQVLINLAVNARDAMPNGGKLVLETSSIELDAAYVHLHPGAIPGKYVLLTVSDTGEGMDAQTRARIFEPFFTTKERGRGTGLGLATTYGIVKQSGGNISVYSEPNQGTTFRLYFPAQEAVETVEEDCMKEGAQEARGGSETILLLEDESSLRELTRTLLLRLGYRVLDAGNPEQAFKIAESCKEPIHLLLTDIVMPGLCGRQAAERLSRMLPSLKIVYMTGYTEDVVIHHKLLESEVHVLRKPFSKNDLASIIRRAFQE